MTAPGVADGVAVATRLLPGRQAGIDSEILAAFVVEDSSPVSGKFGDLVERWSDPRARLVAEGSA